MDKIKKHFDAVASEFDSIYHQDKSWPGRLIDKIFRRGMMARFRFLTTDCGAERGDVILDIGCGSGRYLSAFARQGFETVGVDFSFPMLRLAASLLSEAGCAERCRLICGDFRTLPALKGDVVLAVGVFDYTDDAASLLADVFQTCRKEAWITFPKKKELKAPIRRLRFKWRGCPLYLYSYSEVEELAETLNARYEIIERFEGDYILHLRRD